MTENDAGARRNASVPPHHHPAPKGNCLPVNVLPTVLAIILACAGSAAADDAATIDWGKAGKGETPTMPTEPVVAPPPKLPDSGFDCGTATRMSWDRVGEGARRPGPEEVRRCSRDGFSMEITAPSN